MRQHDIVVLRLGTDQIYGVGEVSDDQPVWFDDFGDVDGWSLQIVRRVRWLWKWDRVSPKTFPVHTLKFGPAVLRLDSGPVTEWLGELAVPSEAWERELALLPETCVDGKHVECVSAAEIGESLYDRGIGEDSVNGLLRRMDELMRIARWYSRAAIAASEPGDNSLLDAPASAGTGMVAAKDGGAVGTHRHWSVRSDARESEYPRGASGGEETTRTNQESIPAGSRLC